MTGAHKVNDNKPMVFFIIIVLRFLTQPLPAAEKARPALVEM
jgi:hypothetical protein